MCRNMLIFLYINTEISERQNDPYPDTYCPSNPRSYEITFDILDEVIDVFHPKAINIGHDEFYSICVCDVPDQQKEQKKATQKDNRKEPQKEAVKQDGTKNETAKHDAENGKDNPKPHHRRGHRGGRKHSGKSAGKEQNPQNGQNATVNHKPQTQKTDA